MKSREIDLEWARQRALYYVTQDRTRPANALASLVWDSAHLSPPLLTVDELSALEAQARPLVDAGDTIGMRELLERIS